MPTTLSIILIVTPIFLWVLFNIAIKKKWIEDNFIVKNANIATIIAALIEVITLIITLDTYHSNSIDPAILNTEQTVTNFRSTESPKNFYKSPEPPEPIYLQSNLTSAFDDVFPKPIFTPIPLPMAEFPWDTFNKKYEDSETGLNLDLWERSYNRGDGIFKNYVGISVEEEGEYLQIEYKNDKQDVDGDIIYSINKYSNLEIYVFEAAISILEINTESMKGYGDIGIGVDTMGVPVNIALRATSYANQEYDFSVVQTLGGNEFVHPLYNYDFERTIILSIRYYSVINEFHTYIDGFPVGKYIEYVEYQPTNNFRIYHQESPGTWLSGRIDETRLTWNKYGF